MHTGLRVALADDDLVFRLSITTLLERSGHHVINVPDEGILVDLCQSQRVDLVIVDIDLSRTDPVVMAEKIIQRQPIPVIVTSTSALPQFLDRAQSLHGFSYHVKPINEADILPAIEMAIGRFKEIQELRQENDALRQNLRDRKTVERAKGIVMRNAGLDEAAAFQRLQSIARNKRLKLVDVAEMIVTVQEAVKSPRVRNPSGVHRAVRARPMNAVGFSVCLR